MRLNTTPLKSSKLLLYTFLATLLASCGTYQSASNDGIYASKEKETKVIVAGSKEHKEYEENYFTSEVARLDRVNGTDILTDIDSYTSLTDEDDLIVENDTLDYTEGGGSWDSGSNTTVVVINNRGFYDYGDYWWNWRWNRWQNRRYRFGGFYNPYWGYNGFYNPYWNAGFYGGFYDPFYCPPFYGYGYYSPYRGYNRYFNNRYYRNNRRPGYLASNTRRYNTSRRNFTPNTRRTTSIRRNTSTIRRNTSTRTRTKPRVRTRNTYTKPRVRTRNTYTKPRVRTRTKNTKPRTRTRTRTRSNTPSRTRTRSSSTRTRSSATRASTRSRSTRSSSSRGSSSRGGKRGRG